MRINLLPSVLCRFAGVAFTLTALFALCASSTAQTETPIYSFTGASDGASPSTTLLPDSSGNYYGTTFSGGSYAGSQCSFFGCGVVFKLSPDGLGGWTETPIYTFTGGTDGAGPAAGLTFDSQGNLYGTALGGGINTNTCSFFTAPGCGVVFKLSPNGSGGWTESVLYSFKAGNDGFDVESPLTFDSAGNMYGTTSLGGPTKKCASTDGCGEVFKLTPNGSGGWTYSVIHFFSDGADGGRPYSGVVIDHAGNIFTNTTQGGNLSDCSAQGCGTLVELAPNGTGYRFRVLHTFTGRADGAFAQGGLFIDSSGVIYAPMQAGGNMAGVCHPIGGCGVIFKETPNLTGGYTPGVAYTFTGGADGYNPVSALVADPSGNLYGAAGGKPAGVSGSNCVGGTCGFIYKLTSAGGGTWTESVEYPFTGSTDGGAPAYPAAVTLDASGNIFGTAFDYGIPNGCSTFGNGCGVAYEIKP
jgi:hypothetical protein